MPSETQSDYKKISSPPAYVSLGSNLGNRLSAIIDALIELQNLSLQPLTVSSIWETTPVNCPINTPMFLNAAAMITPPPDVQPETLLKKLQDIEVKLGRNPKEKGEKLPRIIDIDLITFGDYIRDLPELTLPHKNAIQRKFVLLPLSQLSPHLVLPGHTQTINEYLIKLVSNETLTELLPASEVMNQLNLRLKSFSSKIK